MLRFKKRAKIVTGDVSRRRTWETWCRRYRVVHSRCLFGPRHGPQSVPDVYYALVCERHQWHILSRHRRRDPAMRACQTHARAKAADQPRQMLLFPV